ncbi:MAG: hypothetical protein AB1749_08275 [Pseudomonadota bacterium]
MLKIGHPRSIPLATRCPAAIAMIAAGLLAFTAPLAMGEADCITDWSIAAALVEQEGLVKVERLARMVRGKLAGEIVKTSLCAGKDGWSYRLVVREASGGLRRHALDARQPFGR